MTLDGTIEIMNKSTELLSTGDKVAILVAIIAFFGTIVATYFTNKTTKNISKDNEEFQERMTQKSIDANLIANARIEWIQNVRNITAELLTSYFSILNSTDIELIQTNFDSSIKKTELLILYFGHENKSLGNEDLSLVLNKESNQGKNELIVNFLVLLSEKFREYYSDIQKGEFKRLEEALRQAKNDMYKNATLVKIGESYNEFAEEVEDIMEPMPQEEDVQYASTLEAEYKNKEKQITQLQQDLVLLRNVIRTYLKIEWNKSKTGT